MNPGLNHTQVRKHKVEFLVPDKDKRGISVDNRDVIESLRREMSMLFDGVRRSYETGDYVSKSGEMMEEENTFLKSWFDDNQQEELDRIIGTYIRLLTTELEQEVAAYWVDDVLFLVDLDMPGKAAAESGSKAITNNGIEYSNVPS